MPGLVNGEAGTKKRKAESEKSDREKSKRRAIDQAPPDDEDLQGRILLLEDQITESRRHYNNIAELIGFVRDFRQKQQQAVTAAVALSRSFTRLAAAGCLTRTKDAPENEIVIVEWLRERHREFTKALLSLLAYGDPAGQSAALTLLLRMLKEKYAHGNQGDEREWRLDLLANVVKVIFKAENSQEVREEYVEKYASKYDDVRYHTFAIIPAVLSADSSSHTISNAIHVLSMMEAPPDSTVIDEFYFDVPKKSKGRLRSIIEHKSRAQEAWLAIVGSDLSKEQRKRVLGLISHRIAPWFVKAELLMDFLTDSYNRGGSTSLLALSGLFYLIQDKNLDYPSFYPKLYSLLDAGILHSKHRSRFFRLLDTFLGSTHLPATLVASFIKRLSRLTLHAPPAGIVVVIPWIYNLLKGHPTCTFMIHREVRDENAKQLLKERGMDDPFNMEEPDPMQTNAIESSLWEIQMLQSHYHPNVATLAKIISEQFTKHAYNIEDFLDHSYSTMLDVELSKDLKKAPVVEYEIPKKIFLKQESDSSQPDNLLVKLWDFS